MNISLTPELEALVRRKVESGMYNNASEVIRESLRLMEQNQHLLYQAKLEALRTLIREGETHGEYDGDVFAVMNEVLAEDNNKSA